ncbi:MAG: outer membrane protein transport protein [Candidatus Aminicenantes bacterium]|nr:outer membrane protein transport protein [Candidatus Aminicenantes bacterium]
MKIAKSFFVFLIALSLLSSLTLANGLNLNSLGTRALSMGGAFVGLSDDFSAIFWNPAGVAQFDKKYFGFYGTDLIPSSTYEMTTVFPGVGPLTLVDAKTKTKHYLCGMAAYYHPVTENLVAGIGVYTPSGLGAEWNGADFAAISHNNPSLDWRSKIALVTISPVIAYKLNDQISLGATLNINYGMFDLAMHAGSALVEIPVPPYYMEVDLGQYEESMTGWGYGATFGILVKPNEMFNLGATFRTASTVKFSGDGSISNLSLLGFNSTSDIEREVTWPMWIAGGVAVKPIDNLTLTADIQWTQWSKMDVMKSEFKDSIWKILMAQSGDDERPLHWSDATQIRFGAEYKFETIALRGGYYYDPSPSPDKTMNVLLPSYNFNVITVGIGYFLDNLSIDVGFEYLTGKERNVLYEKVLLDPEYEAAMPGVYNMKIFVPNISISYKF